MKKYSAWVYVKYSVVQIEDGMEYNQYRCDVADWLGLDQLEAIYIDHSELKY